MAIEIKKVATKADLKTFIRFNYEMYKDCAHFVPELYMDMVCTLDRTKNPAFEFCDADIFNDSENGVPSQFFEYEIDELVCVARMSLTEVAE